MSSRLTAGDLQIITRVAVFRGLKPETVQHIIAPATAVVLQRHALIMRQDDPATAFFIVIDGCLKLFRNNLAGDETVIEIMMKGDSFAESIAFTGNRYLASAEAVSKARVARIPADHLVRCIRASPDMRRRAGHLAVYAKACKAASNTGNQPSASACGVRRLRHIIAAPLFQAVGRQSARIRSIFY